MLMWFSVEEGQVDTLPSQTDTEVSREAVARLLESGLYEQHTGLMPGVHYRKARGNGCYHLRVHGGSAHLHWDAWDPRRFPIRHFMESPALVIPALGLAAVVLISAAKD